MKRTRCENLALRIARREVATPPGAVAAQSRRFYENIVPDTALVGPVPPPNTVLVCFTPCGRFLLGFQPVANEVVAYRFKGLHTSTSTHAAAAAQGSDRQQQAAAGPEEQQGQQQAVANGMARGDQQVSEAQQQQQQQPGQQQQPAGATFGDIFEEHWRCSPCPNRQEQISPDLCLIAHGRYLLVCSASPEWQPPAGAGAPVAGVVPRVERTTLHLIELESGVLADSHTIQDDYVELARSQGVHLHGQLLLVLGLASQTLHMLQLLPSGRLHYLHAIGPNCRDDDALVLAQHEERERRLRQQQRRPQHASGVPPAAAASPSALSASSGLQQQQQQQAGGGTASAGGGAGSGLPPATVQQPGPEDPAGGPALTPAPPAAGGVPLAGAAARAAAGQQAAGGGSILSGLKQQLLAYLFREAQRQSSDAAASTSAGAEQQSAPSEPQARGLHASGGSTASLLSAVAPAQPRGFSGLGGSSSSLRGLGGSTSSLGGLGGGESGQPQSAAHLHWRRPLDRFHYYFEAYAEMLMWKAQLMDDQRLLIHWCAPEMLAGPHRHGHSSASHAAHGGGAYIMLYNYCTTEVEQLFVAGSPDLATWYMQQPAAFLAGSCGCGCSTDWQRCLVPLGGSRAAREAQLRDPTLAVKELRHRLWDELPASSQPRQATPFLDPDLYCFDDQIGGAVRPHHPPHRALKFMARRCPEALRFRLEPEHFVPRRGGGGAGGRSGAARPQHVVYLFHPVQPFLMAVLQDIETGLAERLALWARL